MSKDPKLFCFDFDKTIVKGHYHSTLSSFPLVIETRPYTTDNGLIINGKEQEGSKLDLQYKKDTVIEETKKLLNDDKTGIQNKEELLKTFQDLLKDDNNKIAITTFSKYPDAITTTLKELGLTDEQRDKICIIAGYPKDYGPQYKYGKQEHINAAKDHFGIKDYKQMVLIDDDTKNTDCAEKLGVVGIEVKQNDKSYFDKILEFKTGKLQHDESKIDNNYFIKKEQVAKAPSFTFGPPKKVQKSQMQGFALSAPPVKPKTSQVDKLKNPNNTPAKSSSGLGF